MAGFGVGVVGSLCQTAAAESFLINDACTRALKPVRAQRLPVGHAQVAGLDSGVRVAERPRELGGLDLDAHGADTLRVFVAGRTDEPWVSFHACLALPPDGVFEVMDDPADPAPMDGDDPGDTTTIPPDTNQAPAFIADHTTLAGFAGLSYQDMLRVFLEGALTRVARERTR